MFFLSRALPLTLACAVLSATAAAQSVELVPLLTAPGGTIAEFDGKRALAYSAGRFLLLGEGGAETLVPSPGGRAELYEGGVLFARDQNLPNEKAEFTLWNGTLTTTFEGNQARAAGKWLVYLGRTPFAPELDADPTYWDVIRRNLETGEEEKLQDGLLYRISVHSPDVGQNGSVHHSSYNGAGGGGFAWLDGNVAFGHGGRVVQMEPHGIVYIDSLYTTAPVVYKVRINQGAETVEDTLCKDTSVRTNGPKYCAGPVINQGWTGYTRKDDALDMFQVFRRSPTGQHEQLTHEGSSGRGIPEAIDPRGGVMVRRASGQNDSDAQRFLLRGPDVSIEVPSRGRVQWTAGSWYIIDGPTVYKLVLPGEPMVPGDADAGAAIEPSVDAGAAEPSVDAATPALPGEMDAGTAQEAFDAASEAGGPGDLGTGSGSAGNEIVDAGVSTQVGDAQPPSASAGEAAVGDGSTPIAPPAVADAGAPPATSEGDQGCTTLPGRGRSPLSALAFVLSGALLVRKRRRKHTA